MKKFLGFIFSLIMTIVVLVGVAGVGGYVYVKQTYGIDVIKTVKELKTLQQPVDEAKLCPNAYTADDMVDVQSLVNASVDGFITGSLEDGFNVNFEKLPDEMKNIIRLTDKQVCAVAQEVVEQEIEGKIEFGGEKVSVALKQVDFYDVADKGACFNVVISVDMKPLKKTSGNQIMDYIVSLVPDTLYVSSTTIVTHGADTFSYDVKHKELKINNLTAEDTADLFHTLDVVFKAGEAEKWNAYVGQTIMDALVGNEGKNGLAYGLKEIGATDYAFVTEDGEDYFAVLR